MDVFVTVKLAVLCIKAQSYLLVLYCMFPVVFVVCASDRCLLRISILVIKKKACSKCHTDHKSVEWSHKGTTQMVRNNATSNDQTSSQSFFYKFYEYYDAMDYEKK